MAATKLKPMEIGDLLEVTFFDYEHDPDSPPLMVMWGSLRVSLTDAIVLDRWVTQRQRGQRDFEPECDVRVIPRSLIRNVKVLGEAACSTA